MDAETQAKWDRWAKGIARQEAKVQTNAALRALVEKLMPRIAALEAEVEAMKKGKPSKGRKP